MRWHRRGGYWHWWAWRHWRWGRRNTRDTALSWYPSSEFSFTMGKMARSAEVAISLFLSGEEAHNHPSTATPQSKCKNKCKKVAVGHTLITAIILLPVTGSRGCKPMFHMAMGCIWGSQLIDDGQITQQVLPPSPPWMPNLAGLPSLVFFRFFPIFPLYSKNSTSEPPYQNHKSALLLDCIYTYICQYPARQAVGEPVCSGHAQVSQDHSISRLYLQF